MVVGAFPAAKLGILALKQISKPIANILKNRAKNNPLFRKYVCMPPAQFYNWVEVKTKMWAMNLGTAVKVPQLNEAMAIELGANLLGEFIIFSIGAGLLIFEYVRQSKKEAKKEEQTLQEKVALQTALNDLAFQIEKQDTQIRELRRLIYTEHKSWFRSPKSESNELKDSKHPPSVPPPSSESPTKLVSSSTLPPSSNLSERGDVVKPSTCEKHNMNVTNAGTVSSRTL